jgi:excisionase family DNA binding protein
MMNQLLDIGEAASLLKLSHHTLYRWVVEGRVPTVRLGRRLLFDPEALRAWVLTRSRQVREAAPAPGSAWCAERDATHEQRLGRARLQGVVRNG